jgi:hypothetical protein
MDPNGKHHLLLSRIVLGVFNDLLHRNIRPIIVSVGSCENVFTESLPSSGSVHQEFILILFNIFSTEITLIININHYLLSRNNIYITLLSKNL